MTGRRKLHRRLADQAAFTVRRLARRLRPSLDDRNEAEYQPPDNSIEHPSVARSVADNKQAGRGTIVIVVAREAVTVRDVVVQADCRRAEYDGRVVNKKSADRP